MKIRHCVFLVLIPALAWGREYAPRVVTENHADAYSMKTFRQFHRWKDLEGDRLAWEVYKYLVDTNTGLFHMNEVLEGNDSLSEYRTVRDPVKIINVYGYAYCGIFGPLMTGIWQDMGLGKARTLSLPKWNHSTSEVFYNNRWHYMDLDVRAVFRRPDGSLASMDDARRDASLWQGRGPLFFPNDDLVRTRKIYQETDVLHFYGFNQSGHTMDFLLRQGEKLTRWWQPQGGRWQHVDAYHQREWLRNLIEKPPRGPKPNHRHFTVHNYANGRFVYHPNLTEASTDFADGVYASHNVRPGKEGLTLSSPGEGYAIFEFRSPYIMVPVVGKMETRDDDAGASVVDMEAENAKLELSQDYGITWQDVDNLDLTEFVSGTYGYLLRIKLSGKPDEAVVRSLMVTTWVQVAPAALPALQRGKNLLEYRFGDHYGLKTRIKEVRSNGSDPDDFKKHLVEEPKEYAPARKTNRVRGSLVVRVDALPGTKIAWFSTMASFQTHQRNAARNTKNRMAYAIDQPKGFKEIYAADMPTDTRHWHCNVAREIRLDNLADRIYIRYVGDPAINNYLVYAHCLDDNRPSDTPVHITYAWDEDGVRKKHTVKARERGTHLITTKNVPDNHSIELSVPSFLENP